MKWIRGSFRVGTRRPYCQPLAPCLLVYGGGGREEFVWKFPFPPRSPMSLTSQGEEDVVQPRDKTGTKLCSRLTKASRPTKNLVYTLCVVENLTTYVRRMRRRSLCQKIWLSLIFLKKEQILILPFFNNSSRIEIVQN